jgi:hypothetical protein
MLTAAQLPSCPPAASLSGALGAGWTVLWWLAWGQAAMYALMTFGIWYATLRTLGLSSLRHCPRMLRLSFRSASVRELTVAFVLPSLAALLVIVYGVGGGYAAALPLKALLLISLLCSTLFLVPPTTLVFSSSTDRQLRWALALKRWTGGRRVISLLDTGYMDVKPRAGDLWSIVSRRSATLTDVLRTSDTEGWQDSVRELIDISPVVVVDTRVCTRALLFEASTMLSPEYAYKAIFVSEDDGACPVLERLLAEGAVPSDRLVCVVREDELGPLLRTLVVSRDALPGPGGFVSRRVPIDECAARRVPGRRTEPPPPAAALGGGLAGAAAEPDGRQRLSTALTPFWWLMARAVVAHLPLSTVGCLWVMSILPRPVPASFATVVWSLLAFNWAGGLVYFFLARSLKKVSLRGDSLLVSERSREIEIHVSQVSKVTGPDWTTLRRITIHLRAPSAFGKKIVFAGRLFSAGRIARELRRRLYPQAEENGAPNPAPK